VVSSRCSPSNAIEVVGGAYSSCFLAVFGSEFNQEYVGAVSTRVPCEDGEDAAAMASTHARHLEASWWLQVECAHYLALDDGESFVEARLGLVIGVVPAHPVMV
jgi:hypothetical protein